MRKRQIALMCAFSLLVGSCIAPMENSVQAGAKKPALSKKKVTVKLGGTAKISVKRAKGYRITWKSKKKKVATVKKSGKYAAKVTGKKAGKAKIVATLKKGKKRYSLKCQVTVTKKAPITSDVPAQATNTPVVTPDPTKKPTEEPTPSPSATPMNTPEPTPDTYVPKGEGWQRLDLSEWSGDPDNYVESGEQIVLNDVVQVSVPIPTPLYEGEDIEVLVRGSIPEGSNGFRFWMANEDNKTMTTMRFYTLESDEADNGDILKNSNTTGDYTKMGIFKTGEFQIQTVLNHVFIDSSKTDDGVATKLLLKGRKLSSGSSQESLDGTVITGIWVRYGDTIGPQETPKVIVD